MPPPPPPRAVEEFVEVFLVMVEFSINSVPEVFAVRMPPPLLLDTFEEIVLLRIRKDGVLPPT